MASDSPHLAAPNYFTATALATMMDQQLVQRDVPSGEYETPTMAFAPSAAALT